VIKKGKVFPNSLNLEV